MSLRALSPALLFGLIALVGSGCGEREATGLADELSSDPVIRFTDVSAETPLYFSISSAYSYGYREFTVGGDVTAGPGDILKSIGDGTYSVEVPAALLGLQDDADHPGELVRVLA